MYSKERAVAIAKNDIRFIPVGINENVTLKSAKLDKSPNGNPYLEIVFEKDGATLSQTEWKPTKFDNMTEEDLQKKEDTQFSRMMQILLCYYTNDQLVFNGSSFEDFAKEVVNYLNNADKTKLLKVKVVYNDKGYTTLPSYAKYTFIEPMSLEADKKSAIVELSIDKFTKPVVADKETFVTNSSSSTTLGNASLYTNTTSVSTSGSDLPF